MKKTIATISLYDLSKIKFQNNSLLRALGVSEKTSSSSTIIENKEKVSIVQTLSYGVDIGSILIGDNSRSHAPPFLLFVFRLMQKQKNHIFKLFN
jgi:hypothetical protein